MQLSVRFGNYKVKIITILAIIVCTFSVFTAENVFALETIYEKSSEQRLSSGAVLKNYTRFVDKGWLNIDVVEVDLDDKYTSIGLLNSANGLNTFQTVYQMVQNNGLILTPNVENPKLKSNVIAAINGDFFNGNYKNGNTIGLSIVDGEIYTSTYGENAEKDSFGTFALDNKNNGIFGYFSNKISLVAKKSGAYFEIFEINKVSSDYSKPVLYTNKWGEKSLGNRYDFNPTEMLVVKNKVIEVRDDGVAFDIPENGFVVSAYGEAANYIKENFKPKTKVELKTDINLDYEKIKVAISGGAMLVENGRVPEKFASNITGTHPRTAVGLSKDGSTLYLVTVDGRQKSSIGMTQSELADFLIEKGVYNALNLDGGGSTTMVAKWLGEEEFHTINSPSGGTLRMVTNALGVFNTSKKSSLSGIKLVIPEENVFVNCKRKIEVLGYDKYNNPVEVDSKKIKWSYDGVPVSVEDGFIIAGDEAGSATITATIGKATSNISVDVLSEPNEITILPKAVSTKVGEKVSFKLEAKNKNGYIASIEIDEVEFEVISGDGKIVDNSFIPNFEGDSIISVSAGNATSYAKVSAIKTDEIIVDDFESESFYFASYPSEVAGSAELSKKKSYEGKRSVKLSYDFTNTDATRATYVRFNEPIEIDETSEKICVMVYSEETRADNIKAKIVDAKGATMLVTFSDIIPGGSSKKLEYDLSKVSLPAERTE